MVDYYKSFDNLWEGIVNISLSNELDLVLIFLLTFGVVYSVLKYKFLKDQKFLCAVIAVSVSLMSTGLMSWQEFDLTILTYNTFAFVISWMIAYVIFLYFINKTNLLSGFRKAIIIAFGILLYLMSNPSLLNEYIRPLIILATILLVIFDNKINKKINGM